MVLEFFTSLLHTYGYLGVFLVSLIGSASVILPLPSSAIVFAAGAFLNPVLVGALAGLGAAIGEISGYALGLGGRKIIGKKLKKSTDKIEGLFSKHGGFAIITIFAATPLPDDLVGIAAGVLKYPFKKFFIACLIGKILMNVLLAYAGLYSLQWIMNIFASSS